MAKRVYPTVEHIQEVTLFKKKKQAEGALETLKWLDKGAPHKFDGLKGNYKFAMDCWLSFVEDTEYCTEMDCGTVCCIAGAIWSFAERMDGNQPDDGPDVEWFATIKDNWGENQLHPELSKLFYGDDYCLSYITAKQAAKALRKYLKKGVVDWSHLAN